MSYSPFTYPIPPRKRIFWMNGCPMASYFDGPTSDLPINNAGPIFEPANLVCFLGRRHLYGRRRWCRFACHFITTDTQFNLYLQLSSAEHLNRDRI